jgi:putative hemolysin
MSEMAVVSSRKSRLQQMADEGNNNAKTALDLANTPNEFLSTIQIGITLVGTLAGAFGGATIADELSPIIKSTFPSIAPYSQIFSIGIIVLCITYLTILGELFPKRLAVNSPEKIASILAPSLRMLSQIASPLVFMLSASTDLMLRALGIKPSIEQGVTEEEIKILIDQGTDAGVIEEAEQDIMERVFRLGDRRAETIMTPRSEIIWLDISDSMNVMQEKIAGHPYSFFPVCDNDLDNVVGVVQAKDLLSCTLKDDQLNLKDLLLPPLFVPGSMKALKVLEHFKKTGVHLATIIDEYGGVQGVITLTNLLEALVGDIPHIDELAEPQKVKREDGSWLIDGMMSLDDFKEIFDIDIMPEEDSGLYQTIGGFVVMYLERIPAAGDHFVWGGLRFEVVDMDDNRVDKLIVLRIGGGDKDS